MIIQIVLGLCILASNNPADDRVYVSDDFELSTKNPICGLQAMMVAAQSLGKDVDISSYLTSDLISTEKGSSVRDLSKLASLIGLTAIPVSEIDSFFLKHISSPIVLNLAVRSEAKCDGHWITFLGAVNGKWKVYDPNASPALQLVRPSDILTRFKGVGIIVSDENGTTTAWRSRLLSITARFVLFVGVFLFVGLSAKNIQGLAVWVQISRMTTTIIVASIFFFWFDAENVLRNLDSARWMTIDGSTTQVFRPAQYGHIKDEQAQRTHGICLVDARTKHARAISIPGSIQIGVDMNIEEFRASAQKIDKARPIVVFCNSISCSWANIVGQRFAAFGYEDISIYESGMVGYLEHQKMESAYASRNKN